jgi:propionate CoA-transferase
MISIITADEAAAMVPDRESIMVGGNGGMGVPEAILEALGRRFRETGTPRDLDLIHVTGAGAVTEKGLCHLAQTGLVRRVVGGNFGLQLPFMRMFLEEEVEAYNFPQGVMAQLCRAMAAGHPGILTHVGLDTYVDPLHEGGRMNSRSTAELVSRIVIDGKDWLFYRTPKAMIAFLRGTTADEDGYISMEHEGTTREDLSIAQAVHNAGGIVVCQVKRLARRGALHPQMVKIPGFLVDYVVVVPDQMQTYGTQYDPSRSGEMPAPYSVVLPDPLTERRVIARRAALEIREGDIVNLGVGISAMIPNVAAEEGIQDAITLTVESGIVGGVPGYAREFGSAVNPRAIIDQPYQFDFYDGGGLTRAFLSFAEVDREGNVNVTRFGKRYDGAGGFINISQNTKHVVFSGTLTGGKFDVGIENGRLLVRREGTVRKFVDRVGQISFSGKRAREVGQSVLFVTERAVFRLGETGLELIEIAPGMRLDEDIFAQMEFAPAVSANLREMDGRLFRPGPMGLVLRPREPRHASERMSA